MPDQKRRRLSLSEFRKEAQTQAPATGTVLVPKSYVCEVKADHEDEDVLEFVISTGTVDRDNDTINPQGWKLDNFVSGGVVLWAHAAHLPPIAKPLGAWVENNQLRSRAKFTPADMDHPLGKGFGQTVKRMYKEGIMKSTSVGFVPIEWSFNEERGLWAIDFHTQELLEYSAVSVPANPEALVQLGQKGVDLRPLYDWAEQCLDGGAKLIVPRSDIEATHKALKSGLGLERTISLPQIEKTVANAVERILKSSGINSPASAFSEKRTITWATAHPNGTPVAPMEDEWQGGREVREADTDDLMVMATWFDEENPDTKSSFKLPHHRAAGQHILVWRGLTAAMGALLGARGGVDIPDGDRRSVYNHLAKHYRDDFDRDPPEFRDYDEGELKEKFPELFDDDTDEKGVLESFVEFIKLLTKRGRVISAANERRLEDAADLINEVLAQLQADEHDDDDDDDDDDDKELSFDEAKVLIDELVADELKTTESEVEVEADLVKQIIAEQVAVLREDVRRMTGSLT